VTIMERINEKIEEELISLIVSFKKKAV